MEKIVIACWKWKPRTGYRSTFTHDHVNTLRRMVARNCTIPHEFVCITDNPVGIDPDIRIIPLWENPAPRYGNESRPNCFYRVKAFSKEIGELIGKRFMWLDLDCVITGNIDHIVGSKHDFAMWGDTHPTTPYNGSLCIMNAGARERVWTMFNPTKSPDEGKKNRYIGSDQAWIAVALGPDEHKFGKSDGIYSFGNHILRERAPLPDNAAIVMFHGRFDPWMEKVQLQWPWVKENYR